MSGTRTDPFAALLNILDGRARAFGPDRTATHGFYSSISGVPTVTLDDGRAIPNPVITSGVLLNRRVIVVWMQDGHDVCLIPIAGGCV